MGSSLLDSSQPPQHFHRVRGADSGTREVKGDAGERRHILRFLDEVRDACGGGTEEDDHQGTEEEQTQRQIYNCGVFAALPSTVIQARSEANI